MSKPKKSKALSVVSSTTPKHSSVVELSKEALRPWALAEKHLPTIATIMEALKDSENQVIPPSAHLYAACQYARGHNSRGEYLFRQNYLKPMIQMFIEGRDTDTMWEDEAGNIYVQVGENHGDVLHVGHVDTVHPATSAPFQQVEVTKDKILKLAPIVKHSVPVTKTAERWVHGVKTDHHYTSYELPAAPRRCLGSDDGAAVAAMLFFIQSGLEGTYLFTRGEEVGCLGTHFILDTKCFDFSGFKIAVEIDRRGKTDIIYKMSPGLTASKTFAQSLCDALDMGHKPSDRGSITDVGHIAKHIPECVNIAAGYEGAHSDSETTDSTYLNKLCRKMLALDWSALTIERKANGYSVKTAYARPSYARGGLYDDEDFGLGYGRSYSSARRTNVHGDYTDLDLTSTNPVNFATKWQLEGFIRTNVGLMAKVLEQLELSPKDLHTIAEHGIAEPVVPFVAELEDDEDDIEALLANALEEAETTSAEDKTK